MVTSTPNSFIENKAKQHDIPLYINEGKVELHKTGILVMPVLIHSM